LAPPHHAPDDPRQLLRQLYDAAVRRALPLHNTAAHLPPPEAPAAEQAPQV
jgi:hydroxypyruvate reductase